MPFVAYQPQVIAMRTLSDILRGTRVAPAARWLLPRDGSISQVRSEIALPGVGVWPADPDYATTMPLLLQRVTLSGLAGLGDGVAAGAANAAVFPSDAAATVDLDRPGERAIIQEIGVSVCALDRTGDGDDSTMALLHRLNDLFNRLALEREGLGATGAQCAFGAFAATYSADGNVVYLQSTVQIEAPIGA